jgi:hypothetical protein
MHLIQFREIIRDAEVAYAIRPIVRKYLLTVEETTKALLASGVSRAANVAQIATARFLNIDRPLFESSRRFSKRSSDMPTVQQSSAIYFKRDKDSKSRAALFRQLRSSPANQNYDVKQQTFGNVHIVQGVRSGQLWLRGFEV